MFAGLSPRRALLDLLTLLVTVGGGPLMATDELWVTPLASSANDLLSTTSQRNDGQTRFSFTVPAEMGTFVGAEVVLIGQADTTIDYQLQLSILANPSRRTDFGGSLGGGPVTISTGERTEIDVSAIIPQLHSGLDQVSVLFETPTSSSRVQVIGLRFRYEGRVSPQGAAASKVRIADNLEVDGNLTLSGLDCTANSNGGALTADASGVVSCSDDDAGGGGGNTLDGAYDQGGAGVGRTITADTGAVTIAGSGGLELDTGTLLQTPGDPVFVGSLGLGGAPQSVYVSGRYAYVVSPNSNDLKVIDVSGGEFTSLIAHSLEAGNLQVRNDMIAQGQVQVTGGLNVGTGGIFSDGNVGIDGNVQIVGTVAIKNAAIPITSIVDGVQLYAEDDAGGSGLSELKVRDEGGGTSPPYRPTISP